MLYWADKNVKATSKALYSWTHHPTPPKRHWNTNPTMTFQLDSRRKLEREEKMLMVSPHRWSIAIPHHCWGPQDSISTEIREPNAKDINPTQQKVTKKSAYSSLERLWKHKSSLRLQANANAGWFLYFTKIQELTHI